MDEQSMSATAVPHRGLVLHPADLAGDGWLTLFRQADLNVLGLHAGYAELCAFAESDDGRRVLDTFRAAGIDIEYELHFLPGVLTADLFRAHPDWFCMDTRGVRYVEGANPCGSSRELLEHMRGCAAEAARRLVPTTGRYHLWASDAKPWCHCRGCADLSPSDQNLRLMNAMVEGIRQVDPAGQLACLAYMETEPAPKRVRPAPGVFLEFAPCRRNFRIPLDEAGCWTNRESLRHLREWLAIAPPATAKVLEYWLDVSFFSCYRRPAQDVGADGALLRRDVALYAGLGLGWITSFAVWMDRDYLVRFGTQAVELYGRAFRSSAGGARV